MHITYKIKTFVEPKICRNLAFDLFSTPTAMMTCATGSAKICLLHLSHALKQNVFSSTSNIDTALTRVFTGKFVLLSIFLFLLQNFECSFFPICFAASSFLVFQAGKYGGNDTDFLFPDRNHT